MRAAAHAYWRLHWHAIAGGFSAFVLVLAVVAHCAPAAPVASITTAQLADSLAATKQPDARAGAADHAVAVQAIAAASRSQQAARSAQAQAEAAGRRADSLAGLLAVPAAAAVPATESLTVLVQVVAAQDTEMTALHAVIRADAAGAVARDTAIAALRRDTLRLSLRLVATTDLADRWRGEFTRVSECTVLWVRCPSRTQTFVGGVVTTVAAVLILRR